MFLSTDGITIRFTRDAFWRPGRSYAAGSRKVHLFCSPGEDAASTLAVRLSCGWKGPNQFAKACQLYH